MSSASGVDRSNQNQELQRIRDEYQKNETAEAKRHRKEVEQLNKSHNESYNRLHEIDDAAADNIKGQARETLNARDQKYQKEMQDLKNMHNQRLRNLSEKNDTDLAIARNNRDEEVNKSNQMREQQLSVLRDSNADDHKENELEFSRYVKSATQSQGESLGDQREKLQAKFDTDKKAIYDARDKRISELQKDVSDLKRQKRLELDEQKMHSDAAIGNRQHDFEHNLIEERRNNNRVLDTYRDGFKEAKDEIAERYVDAVEKNNENQIAERDKLKGRTETRLTDLSRRLKMEREDAATREAELRRLSGTEKKHVVEAADDRVRSTEKMFSDRNMDLRARDAKQVNALIKENDARISKSNVENRMEVAELTEKEKENRRQIVTELNQAKENEKLRGELRTRKVTEVYNQKAEGMSEFYADSIDQLKKNQETILQEQRIEAMKQRNAAVAGLERHIRKAEAQFNDKFDRLALEYQKDIENQKTDSLRQMRALQQGYERILSEKDHELKDKVDIERSQSQRQLDIMQQKYEAKLAQIDKRAELDKIELAKRK